jgi:hypothetical protein
MTTTPILLAPRHGAWVVAVAQATATFTSK